MTIRNEGDRLRIEEDAMLLRVFLGESDRAGAEPAFKALVHLLRQRGIWGATVLKGVYGFGARSVLHAMTPLRLSGDLPVVVEAVDRAEKIESVLPDVCELVKGGLVTTERVRVVRHT